MVPKPVLLSVSLFALCTSSVLAQGVYDPVTNRSYVFDPVSRSWENARANAIASGGSLASIANQRENDIIHSFANTDAWIGFTDNEAYGGIEFGDTSGQPLFPAGNRGRGWVWSDSSPVNFMNWGDGEPNDAGGEDFANIRGDGFWNDLPASSSIPSIIKYTGNRVAGTFNGHTYFVIPSATWLDAESQAIALGGHLVSIGDAAENAFVDSLITDQMASAWIGFNDRSIEGQFVWSDGSPVTYTNWNGGEPNDFGGAEDIAEFYNGGFWNDNAETATGFGVVEVVPEPGSLLLLAAALPVLLRRRSRRPA